MGIIIKELDILQTKMWYLPELSDRIAAARELKARIDELRLIDRLPIDEKYKHQLEYFRESLSNIGYKYER